VETLVAAGVPEAEIDVNATQAPADISVNRNRSWTIAMDGVPFP
jgi:hypothetical protein